jgi:hypothetical protein
MAQKDMRPENYQSGHGLGRSPANLPVEAGSSYRVRIKLRQASDDKRGCARSAGFNPVTSLWMIKSPALLASEETNHGKPESAKKAEKMMNFKQAEKFSSKKPGLKRRNDRGRIQTRLQD